MSKIAIWILPLSLAILAWGATPVKKAPAKKGGKTTSTKTTGVKKSTTTAKKSPTKSVATKGGKKAPVTTWRNRQMAPTSERYREIQQALATRGYLNSEGATGSWNQDSIEALKRFQTDQNIVASGKINSLSLIALGLGPKHEVAASVSDSPKQ